MDVPIKAYKKDFAHSYTLGVFPTLELLQRQPGSAMQVLLDSRGTKNEGVSKIKEICSGKRIPFEINDKVVSRLSPKENVYAIGIFKKYSCQLEADKNHLALVNPGDMGNLGTVIRTMTGFGVTNLAIVRPAVDIFDPKVVRASMGALFSLSFEYFNAFNNYQARFNHAVYPFMTNGKLSLDKIGFRTPFTLVFGNESSGLPGSFLQVGTSVSIPHSKDIDSLNLPTAVGIALYEATKGQF